MSQQCHVCGQVKHEAPTVICALCALDQVSTGQVPWITVTGPPPLEGGTLTVFDGGRAVELEVAADETNAQVAQRLADALNASEMRSVAPLSCCQRCGGLMLTSSAGDKCAAGCP